MISRIEAFKYRCFDRLDIKVGQYHVLAGANGTGKSTLLDIPLLLSEILSRGLIAAFLESPSVAGSPRAQNLQELVHYQQGNNFGFAIEANLPEGIIANLGYPELSQQCPSHVRYEVKFLIVNNIELHAEELLQIISKPISTEKNLHVSTIIKRGLDGVTILNAENNKDNITLRLEPQELALANVPRDSDKFSVALWFRNLLERSVMRYEPSWSLLRRACPPGQPKTLRSDAANLPWLVLNLQQQEPDLFNSWVEHIKMALPNLIGIKALQREEDYHAYLQLKYSGNHTVTSSGLSYGTLHILALTILPYLSQQSNLIFLEEPENHLHPRLLPELTEECRAASANSQLMITTHSPFFVDNLKPEELWVLYRDENGFTQAKRTADMRGIKEFIEEGATLGSLWMEDYFEVGNPLINHTYGGQCPPY